MSSCTTPTTTSDSVDKHQFEVTSTGQRKRDRETTPSKVSPPSKNLKITQSDDPNSVDIVGLDLSGTTMTDVHDDTPGGSSTTSVMTELKQLFNSPGIVAMFENIIDRSIKRNLQPLQDKLRDQNARITELEGKVDNLSCCLTSANQRIDDMEQYSRRSSLRVWSTVKETTGEQTDNIVCDVAKELGLTIDSDEIDRSHRVGRPSTNKPRAILVKFISYKTRDKLYNARRKAKKGIFISEDLTRHRQDIFYKARQHQKAGTFSHTWTKDGRILVRLRNGDVRQISTIFDLDTTVDAVSEDDRQKVLQTRRGPGTQRVIVDRSHVQSNEQSADGQLSTTDQNNEQSAD